MTNKELQQIFTAFSLSQFFVALMRIANCTFPTNVWHFVCRQRLLYLITILRLITATGDRQITNRSRFVQLSTGILAGKYLRQWSARRIELATEFATGKAAGWGYLRYWLDRGFGQVVEETKFLNEINSALGPLHPCGGQTINLGQFLWVVCSRLWSAHWKLLNTYLNR